MDKWKYSKILVWLFILHKHTDQGNINNSNSHRSPEDQAENLNMKKHEPYSGSYPAEVAAQSPHIVSRASKSGIDVRAPNFSSKMSGL